MADFKSKFRGCLIGGAIGDALGYPIEFMSMGAIRKTYGSDGIQALDADPATGTAMISDDTQMTLFTASGLLRAVHIKETTGGTDIIRGGIYPSYLRWLHAQGYAVAPDILIKKPFEAGDVPAIMEVRELYARRAPGASCIGALSSGRCGSPAYPINNSKGCGGVMRVAPIGLTFHDDPELACRIAIDAAAITHGHPTGYLAAGAFAYLITMLVNGETLEAASVQCADYMEKQFHDNAAETVHCMQLARSLAKRDISAMDAIAEIGEGWVAEEALGIALYASLKATDAVDALRIAVNHDGDSDSTGAICGNLLGAMYGIEVFPQTWAEQVEMSDSILDMADELYDSACDKTIGRKGEFHHGV